MLKITSNIDQILNKLREYINNTEYNICSDISNKDVRKSITDSINMINYKGSLGDMYNVFNSDRIDIISKTDSNNNICRLDKKYNIDFFDNLDNIDNIDMFLNKDSIPDDTISKNNLFSTNTDFLHFYDIDILSNIIELNFIVNIDKYSKNKDNQDNQDNKNNEDNKQNYIISTDVGQIIIGNIFRLYVLYLNKSNVNILFPRYQVINLTDNETICNMALCFLKIDIDKLLFSGFNVNTIYNINSNQDENVSLLGFFMSNFIDYFFSINSIYNLNIYYDFISKLFILLMNVGCNPCIINKFKYDNIMSISAYVLYLMTVLNNKRLELIKDNLSKTSVKKIKKKDNNSKLLKKDNYSKSSKIDNNGKSSKTYKSSKSYSRKYKMQYIYSKIPNNELNMEVIKRTLSLLTWIFDSMMNIPDILDSDIICMNSRTLNIPRNSGLQINTLKDFIYSDLISKECQKYIIDKHLLSKNNNTKL